MSRWALGVALLLTPAAVSAQSLDRPVLEAVELHTADACFAPEAVAEQVRHWLHRDRIDARLTAVLHDDGHARRLEVMRDGEVVAERPIVVQRGSCAERREALGLVIALAVDAASLELDDATAPSAPPESADAVAGLPAQGVPAVAAPSPAQTTPRPSAVAPRRQAPTARPVPPHRSSFALDAAGVADVGVLAGPGLGALVGLELTVLDWLFLRAALGGAIAPDVRVQSGSISSAMLTGALLACAGADARPFRFDVCAGLSGGPMHLQGRGYVSEGDAVVSWLAVDVGVAARVRLSDVVSIRLAVDLVAPFVRAGFTLVDTSGTPVVVTALSPVGATLSLGPAFAFP